MRIAFNILWRVGVTAPKVEKKCFDFAFQAIWFRIPFISALHPRHFVFPLLDFITLRPSTQLPSWRVSRMCFLSSELNCQSDTLRRSLLNKERSEHSVNWRQLLTIQVIRIFYTVCCFWIQYTGIMY